LANGTGCISAGRGNLVLSLKDGFDDIPCLMLNLMVAGLGQYWNNRYFKESELLWRVAFIRTREKVLTWTI
jgi:hypothetical protein